MRLNSLAFRLFATAVVSTMLILPVAGLLIYSVYWQEVEEGFNERLSQLLTIVHADVIGNRAQPVEQLTRAQPRADQRAGKQSQVHAKAPKLHQYGRGSLFVHDRLEPSTDTKIA